MQYRRMTIEAEAPEELGYDRIENNLSESAIADRTLRDLGVDLDVLAAQVLHYGDHRGEPALRALIASQGGADTGNGEGSPLQADDVLLTTGAAGALFIVATALLQRDSHLVVVRPNYATNLETPRAIGADVTAIDLHHETGFRLDVDAVAGAVRPGTTLISVTVPHNPTGTVMPWRDLQRLDAIAARVGCRVLVDETYRDLAHGEPYPSAATISERFIAVSSLSKAYGCPGLRLGWLATRDAAIGRLFLAAKEQIGICGAVIDEHVGLAVLRRRDAWLPTIRERNSRHLRIVTDWIAGEAMVEWVLPQGGVVCFPRMVVGAGFDVDAFYRRLLDVHGTYVGPGHWFEMPKAHMRIGFAWPSEAQLRNGLAAISSCLRHPAPGA